jgi:hypothetical protein
VTTATYRLEGLDASAHYTLTDLDSQQTCTLSGQELAEQGYVINIPGKPGAVAITYRQL